MNTLFKMNMKTIVLSLICIIIASSKTMAQQDSTVYPVVIQFNSIGTGVPGDSVLRTYINSFRKKNKVKKICVMRIGPMGREGEYWLAFPLKELSKKKAAQFTNEIKAVAEKPTERGSTSFRENMVVVKSTLGRATIKQISL